VNLVFCDSHITQQVQYHLLQLHASFLQFVIFLRLKFNISNPTINQHVYLYCVWTGCHLCNCLKPLPIPLFFMGICYFCPFSGTQLGSTVKATCIVTAWHSKSHGLDQHEFWQCGILWEIGQTTYLYFTLRPACTDRLNHHPKCVYIEHRSLFYSSYVLTL